MIIWADDARQVVALTPPGGLTVEEAEGMAPKDRPHFVVDSATLPHGSPMVAWRLENGAVIVDQAAADRATVPTLASSGDFIRALHELGWIADVKAAVASVDGLAEDLWLHAATFERRHPLVLQIATAIGKTEVDLDALFKLARTYG